MTKGFGKSDERRIDTTVSKRLRMYRIARNLTQTDLGNALNVTFQEIQKYEKGTNSMASGRLRLACDALRVTPNDLFGVHVNGGSPMPELSVWACHLAFKLDQLDLSIRGAVQHLVERLVEHRQAH